MIDWDECLSMPAVVTRKPPIWLYDFSDAAEHLSFPAIYIYDGADVDLLPPAHYVPGTGRLDGDKPLVRERFKARLIDRLSAIYPKIDRATYLDDAYGRGRWLRLVARFAIHGVHDNRDYDRFDHLQAHKK